MPKRLTANAPRMKRAGLAKLRVCILELTAVKPYMTADMDTPTRKEVREVLQRTGEAIIALGEWVAEMKDPEPDLRPRVFKARAPISMSGGGKDDSSA